ncbi:hypothetical protein AArcCO_4099 (plasmid) [Halalkaliarchaeum sp. AArc-CO]|uniref:hypothetical protein n=1 Tax=Halalkaliarchaeum sp. AArc-CO TaxID=2866381 RepID=UPI00217D14CA|nr:hypothetical protein [Halalkaliarchaeum sp. AArc-CO]UWG49274.1 hypothetical protein AArcCO_4099 [Halalkaliarchaeum sp. AArc-CO]
MADVEQEALQSRTVDRKRVGIDAKGRPHYFDPLLGVVWVTVDGEIAHIEEAGLENWMDFVSTQVGWREQYYDDRTLAEHILDTISLTSSPP